jgi:hypothetical protein
LNNSAFTIDTSLYPFTEGFGLNKDWQIDLVYIDNVPNCSIFTNIVYSTIGIYESVFYMHFSGGLWAKLTLRDKLPTLPE